ncbi:hypothetical protein GCM10010140_03470 [Streptosporangium pseudovulgare]|uniref:Uncharacterized protein n=1 Tax=Streptosporangium pseudovulgare TaxID=35765 RepID=A0ABQ2QFA7_9ACTN|nr:hypothetical protein GCM10010140_03470 [Streptosporangium pseudovulgare]
MVDDTCLGVKLAHATRMTRGEAHCQIRHDGTGPSFDRITPGSGRTGPGPGDRRGRKSQESQEGWEKVPRGLPNLVLRAFHTFQGDL